MTSKIKVGQLRTLGEDKRVYLVLETFNEKIYGCNHRRVKIFLFDVKEIRVRDREDMVEDPLLAE